MNKKTRRDHALKMMKSEAASIMEDQRAQKRAGKKVQTWCVWVGAWQYMLHQARKRTKRLCGRVVWEQSVGRLSVAGSAGREGARSEALIQKVRAAQTPNREHVTGPSVLEPA